MTKAVDSVVDLFAGIRDSAEGVAVSPIGKQVFTVVTDTDLGEDQWHGEVIGKIHDTPVKVFRIDIETFDSGMDTKHLNFVENQGMEQALLDDVDATEHQADGAHYMDAICKSPQLEDNGNYQTYIIVEGDLKLTFDTNVEGDTAIVTVYYGG